MTDIRKFDILIVDDLPDNLRLLVNILSKHDYLLRTLSSGALALQAIERRPPDLILLDITMPEMDGFEVCRRLKADPRFNHIPIIFISALSDTSNKVRAIREGGVDYITKPFQVEEVTARIETHLHLQSLREELRERNENLEKIVKEKVQELTAAQNATIRAMTKLAEARDDDTGVHIERIRIFCRILAVELKKHPDFSQFISGDFIENLFQASPLHDIGKIAIRDSILLKPGKLDPGEFEIMKTHTTIGSRNMEDVQKEYPKNSFISMGIKIARSHHERWDGSGYPDGLSGETIPLCARIMSLADVYDALRSRRVYKEPFSHEKSRSIILEGSGGQFDPRVIDAFLTLEDEFETIRDSMDDD